MLYYHLVEAHLGETGAVLSDGQQGYDYRQLHERICGIRAGFKERGLKPGDRVMIAAHNRMETIVTVLACIADGYIFVLFYPDLPEEEKTQIRENCRPVLCMDGADDVYSEQVSMEKRMQMPADTRTCILYTSGSDGMPKGVTVSQKQILFCCGSINQRLMNTEEDRILCCLPLAFDYGLYQVFLAFLNHSLLYIADGKMLQKIPRMLSEWKITAFPTLPSVMNLLIRTSLLKKLPLPLLRYISFTGEYLPVELIKKLMAAYPNTEIVPMYGLTECKRVSIMPFGRNDKKLAGSCGLPIPGIHVRLKDQDPDTGIGELIVSGPNVMEGYWEARDSNTYAVDEATGETCVCTGDLFRIDEDGFLYFCGRKSRIMKMSGHRVSGIQIERKLEQLAGGSIRELAVFGVKDEYRGEKAAIFVYSEDPEAERKIRQALKSLPEYMRNYVLYVQRVPLPRNRNGKIDEVGLRKRMEDREEHVLRK